MAGKKRTLRRPRGPGRKRMRMTVSRAPRLAMGKCLVKRTFARELWSLNGGNVDGFWRYYTATLGQLPSIAELASVFDQIKICAMKFTFHPRFDNMNVTSGGVPTLSKGYAHVIIDPASNVNPSGVYNRNTCNTFLENGSVKTYDYNKKFSVYFKPFVAYRLGGDDFATYRRAPYINTVSGLTTPHRGFHIFLQDTNFVGATGPQWDVFVTYYMKCQNLK